MVAIAGIITLVTLVLVFLISAIPLHIAVKVLGGRTNLVKTALIGLIAGILAAIVKNFFDNWGALIGFIVLIWIYREAFKLRWWKAFVAWFLQFVIIGIIIFLLSLLAFI